MKHVLRRIVPFLLAIAVMGCAVWYLFIYDRDFTRDILVTQARYLNDAGYHKLAGWFYDQAYLHANNDDSVAIELSQQYRESGNYTKAEYTLTQAISAKPTVQLYTALCRLFVEQDKLIDAVALLDNITDSTIKQEIDLLRPAAPTVNQDPGLYHQYIDLEITCNGGTLLYSTDREYPSVVSDLYTGVLSLEQGQTLIYALCVGENGLVSSLARYGFTIGSVIEEVVFTDVAIETAIREILELDADAPIYSDALWNIQSFTVPMDAVTYSDLSKLTGLTKLEIYNAKPDELNILSAFPQLQELTITGAAINQSTMNVIGSLNNLTRLTLAQCELSDLSALTSLTGITYLDLSYNFIKELGPLSQLKALETLYLSNNAIINLTPLSSLPSLLELNVNHNSITSLQPICNIRSLVALSVNHNQLKNLSDLDLLPALEYLDASYNKLNTIAVLGQCTGLTTLNISNNMIDDIEPLSEHTALQELNCSYNLITQLPKWTSQCGLIILDASFNDIKDITVLGKLASLNLLNLDYNPRIKSVSALANCHNLIEVDLFGTKVTDVSKLTNMSVIVNYNPTDVDVDVPDETE